MHLERRATAQEAARKERVINLGDTGSDGDDGSAAADDDVRDDDDDGNGNDGATVVVHRHSYSVSPLLL